MEKLENIDIEKSKELFAYEMTEVLLMLKGEFASVSGKDMRYEQWAVDAKKKTIPSAHIAPVQLEHSPISLPAVNKAETVKIPDAPTVDASVCLPSVPSFDLRQLPQVTVEAKKLTVPVVTPMEQKASVPQVQVQKFCVSVPAAAIMPKAEIAKVDVQKITPNLPQVAIPQPDCAISVSVNPVEIQIPEVPGFSLPPMNAPACADFSVEIPPLPQLPEIQPCCVQIQRMDLDVPAVSQIPHYAPQAVCVAQPAANPVIIPAMPQIPELPPIQQASNLTEDSMLKISVCLEKLASKPTFTPKELVLEKKTAPTPQTVDVADMVSQFRASLGV